VKNTCKKEVCEVCFNGYTKDTCPKRKLENERLVLSLILIVSLSTTIMSFM